MASTRHEQVRVEDLQCQYSQTPADIAARWLWSTSSFVTPKIFTNDVDDRPEAKSELDLSQCIATADPQADGLKYLRTVAESFEVKGPDRTHIGLVYAPMGQSLKYFQPRIGDNQLPSSYVKGLLQMLLSGLDYLHTKCHIIHTGMDFILILILWPSVLIVNFLQI